MRGLWRKGLVGEYMIWAVVLGALLLHLPLAPANEIQTKFIAQESACTGELNTITITLQV
jgi:hypothetical protein